MSDAQTANLISYLDEYCFGTVWNSVHEESRVNLVLNPLHDRLQTSSTQFRRVMMTLPVLGVSYMTYYFAYTLVQELIPLPVNVWVNSQDVLNKNQLWVSIYDVNGRVMPMAHVWMIRPQYSTDVIVIVDKGAMLKCASNGLSTSLYLTIFKGVSSARPMQSWSFNPTGAVTLKAQLQVIAQTLSSAVLQNTAGTILTVNGYEYAPTQSPVIAAGDYVDILLDQNVVTAYSTVIDLVPGGYQSSLYNGVREIIHCPKLQNPSQQVWTHNSATLYVRDVASGRGVLLHRTSPVSVKQITHNDISIDRTVLNALIAGLGSSQVSVVTRQRAMTTPNILMDDAYYLADLYLCDDATIIQLLRGAGDATLGFWQASQLEQSSYIGLMFSDEYILDASRLSLFITALGYYNIGTILCHNLRRTLYQGEVVIVDKPYIYQGAAVTVLAYKNGRKLPQAGVLSYLVSSRKIAIDLSESLYVHTGDAIEICLLEGGALNPVRFTPTSTNPSITLSYQDLVAYRELPQATAQVGYKRQSLVAYSEIVAGSRTFAIYTNADGSYAVTFYPALYGVTVLLQPGTFMHTTSTTIDTMLSNNQPLVLPVSALASDGTMVPVLSYGSSEVYVNGYRLVETIDYALQPLSDGNGVYLLDVVIANQNFLNLQKAGNTVDIFIYSGERVSTDIGYAVQNILPRQSRVTLWYSDLARSSVEGVLAFNLEDYGVYMVSPTPVKDGAVFELSVTYPRTLLDVLSNYSPVADQQRLALIDTYLDRTVPVPPAVIPITQQHALYSPYILAIAGDIVNHSFIAVNDPDDQAFLRQFSPYAYLQSRDPTLSQNNAVDRRFISIAAAYSELAVTSPANAIIIQRLISMVLLTTNAALGDVLI